MSGLCPRFAAMAMVLLSAGAVFSCKDRKENVSSDLKEAGFEVTSDGWFRACREGNVEAMKKFLSAGFSKDTRDAAGDTSLHVAALAGQENAADFLLRRGVAIDSKGAKGRTPLMAAAAAGKSEMVSWLLRQGADPQAKDDEGFKALMISVREGNSKVVEQLAAYDREDLDNGLLLAALLGKANVIDSLTNYGASVYSRMEDGRTPLMIAAENGHVDAVKLLIDLGASRYTVNAEGKTAAQLAGEAGHPEIVSVINQEPAPTELALQKPEEISAEMDAAVDTAAGISGDRKAPVGGTTDIAKAPSSTGAGAAGKTGVNRISTPIEGAVLGTAPAADGPASGAPPAEKKPPVI
ncbi:MAG TPA: ankyrin repeat domain-containing protein, partial [Luteolibacter sp.]|nr:ankyrin repeat domain-containing protein [Luteolibacter sp.]